METRGTQTGQEGIARSLGKQSRQGGEPRVQTPSAPTTGNVGGFQGGGGSSQGGGQAREGGQGQHDRDYASQAFGVPLGGDAEAGSEIESAAARTPSEREAPAAGRDSMPESMEATKPEGPTKPMQDAAAPRAPIGATAKARPAVAGDGRPEGTASRPMPSTGLNSLGDVPHEEMTPIQSKPEPDAQEGLGQQQEDDDTPRPQVPVGRHRHRVSARVVHALNGAAQSLRSTLSQMTDGEMAAKRKTPPERVRISKSRWSDSLGTNAFNESRARNKKRYAANAKGRRMDARSIVDEAWGDPSVPMNGVSIGTEDLSEVLRNPTSHFLEWLQEATGQSVEQVLGTRAENRDIAREIRRILESHPYYVGVGKSPINDTGSAQRRRLYIHDGRGILMNPTQSKSFNADFDGDQFTVQLDPRVARSYRDGMSFLVMNDGNPGIDPDFFPHMPLTAGRGGAFGSEREAKDALRQIVIEPNGWDERIGDADRVVDALFELCEGGDILPLCQAVSQAAGFQMRSDLLGDIYESMRTVLLYGAETKAGTYADDITYQLPEGLGTDPASVIVELIDTFVPGRSAMNFQDFKVAMSQFIGESPDGKNIQFRINTNIAKMVRIDPDVRISARSEDELRRKLDDKFAEMYQSTCSFATSLRMSRIASLEDRHRYVGEMLRASVIEEVGFPDSSMTVGDGSVIPKYRSVSDFMQALYRSYSKYERIARMASTEFTWNAKAMQGRQTHTKEADPTVGGMRDALKAIYGDVTMGRMFARFGASFSMLSRYDIDNPKARDGGKGRYDMWGSDDAPHLRPIYENMTITQFVNGNKLRIETKDAKASLAKGVANCSTGDVIRALADNRGAQASRYNKALVGRDVPEGGPDEAWCKEVVEETACGAWLRIADEITRMDDGVEEGADFYAYADELVAAMFETSPSLFMALGMDSPQAFAQSKWGREIFKAMAGFKIPRKRGEDDKGHIVWVSDYAKAAKSVSEKVQQLASIRVAMVVGMRVGRVSEARAKVEEMAADERNDAVLEEDVDCAINDATRELNELSSSSMAWHAICCEAANGNRRWKSLCDGNGLGNMTENAKAYWEGDKRHEDVLHMLMDTKMAYSDKMRVLSDLVRSYERMGTLNGFEMGYQLEHGASVNSLNVFASDESSKVIDALDSTPKTVTRALKKSWEAARDEVKEAKRMIGKNVLTCLEGLDRPGALVGISPDIVPVALASILDKGYETSEKSRQMDAMKALYQSLENMLNGGAMASDVYRGDDRALGLTRWDMVTPKMVVHVLADQNSRYDVYYPDGHVEELSRASLCGTANPTPDDVWRLFESHPRLAMSIRHCETNVGEGGSPRYMTCTKSLAETLSDARRHSPDTRTMMANHYMFHALVALSVPLHHVPADRARWKYREAEDNLCAVVNHLASMMRSSDRKIDIESFVRDELGLSVEGIMAAGADQSVFGQKEYEGDDAGAGVSRDVAERIIGYLCGDEATPGSLLSWAREIADLGDDGSRRTTFHKLPFDKQSVAMYFDAMQELSGCKTAISVGVEGGETRKIALGGAMLVTEDTYCSYRDLKDAIGGFGFSGVIQTNVGEVDLSRRDDDEGSLQWALQQTDGKDDGLVIDCDASGIRAQGHVADGNGRQLSSIGQFLMIKRDKGAEEFNLKVKKVGTDGTDRIVKTSNEPVNSYGYVSSEVQAAFDEGGMTAARSRLAHIMYDVNVDMGYTDMDIAAYMNIAACLIQEDDAGGRPVVIVRSLEQLIYAIKDDFAHDAEFVAGCTPEQAKERAMTVASRVGVQDEAEQRDIASLLSATMRQRATNPNYQYDLINAQESSFFRNHDLLMRIHERTGSGVCSDEDVKLFARHVSKEQYAEVKRAEALCKRFGYRLIGTIGYGSRNVASIGPGDCIYWGLESDVKELDDKTIRWIQDHGMTLMVDPYMANRLPRWLLNSIDGNVIKDIRDDVLVAEAMPIRFFDRELNDQLGYGQSYVDPRSATWVAPEDRLVTGYEDRLLEYGEGDSTAHLFKSLIDRIRLTHHGHESISYEELFSDTISTFPNAMSRRVEIVGRDELQWVATHLFDRPSTIQIDYGLSQWSKTYDKLKEDTDKRLVEFLDSIYATDENGVLRSAYNDQCIALAKMDVEVTPGQHGYVYAPIIPFRHEGPLEGPRRYRISPGSYVLGDSENVADYGRFDQGAFSFSWDIATSIDNLLIKMHEGAGAANKMMAMVREAGEQVRLLDGTDMDVVYSMSTTNSRRGGTLRRMATMKTMFYMARRTTHGYNIAETKGAFPGNDELRQAALTHRQQPEWWFDILDRGIAIHEDERIDRFVKATIRKVRSTDCGVNPSDFLASRYAGEDGQSRSTMIWFEPEFVMEDTVRYENELLYLYNHMVDVPEGEASGHFCPPSIEDADDSYLFRPKGRGKSVNDWQDYDLGTLQMQVPHRSIDGSRTFYTWENVYMGWSFFGENGFSGMKRTQVNGASRWLDALNTYGLDGSLPKGKEWRIMLGNWLSSYGGYSAQRGIQFGFAPKDNDEGGEG